MWPSGHIQAVETRLRSPDVAIWPYTGYENAVKVAFRSLVEKVGGVFAPPIFVHFPLFYFAYKY